MTRDLERPQSTGSAPRRLRLLRSSCARSPRGRHRARHRIRAKASGSSFLTRQVACRIPSRASSASGCRERVGQSIVVENRPGGNGSVAAATSRGAGRWIFPAGDRQRDAVGEPAVLQAACLQSEGFPAGRAARARAVVLAVHADVPVGTLREFIDYAKARPGQINYGSSGVGSTHHLTMEAMKAALHLNMTHIPYRGTGQSVPALLGGHVKCCFRPIRRSKAPSKPIA